MCCRIDHIVDVRASDAMCDFFFFFNRLNKPLKKPLWVQVQTKPQHLRRLCLSQLLPWPLQNPLLNHSDICPPGMIHPMIIGFIVCFLDQYLNVWNFFPDSITYSEKRAERAEPPASKTAPPRTPVQATVTSSFSSSSSSQPVQTSRPQPSPASTPSTPAPATVSITTPVQVRLLL